MTDSLRPGLQPVSHLKAGPTTSSSRSSALHSSAQPPITRPSSRLRIQRAPVKEEQADATSEKATIALIRRVLCPQTTSHGASSPRPVEDLLPPLTSSNDVDRQLYALLAIIIKEFVYSWYSKITPDQALVNEVLQVVAHCTRALEQRIRRVDVAQLILDEIPALVEAHILSYRLAKQQSHLSGLSTSHRTLYHELNPHPGLSPVPDPADPDTITAQSENEAVYRHLLANGTLAVLLPTEDLENGGLRTLVGDILADLILGKEVAGRICEGLFFWEIITKLATTAARRGEKPDARESSNHGPTNQLERFGLLSAKDERANSQPAVQSRFAAWIWNVLQSLYFCYLALHFIATGLFRAASNPGQSFSQGAGVSFPAATPGLQRKQGVEYPFSSSDGAGKRPVLDYRLCSMASQLLGISQRMPWLSGVLALSQHLILAGPGRLGDTDGVLDRFLRETIEEYILPPTLLPNLLLATRSALFPANVRPSSLGVPVNTGTPVSTPQVSVQPPTPSVKTIANATPTVPVVEGARFSVETSNISAKSHNAGNNNDNNNVGSGHLPGAGLSPGSAPLSPLAVDAISTSPADPTGSENTLERSNSEIAAIKRRCAVSLLAVIPRSVARTFFGVPPSSNRDRTCSAATGGSPSLTRSSPSPPSSRDEGGEVPPSAPFQDGKPGDSSTSPMSSSTTVSIPSSSDETTTQQHTDDTNQLDREELYLLETIETDLLDLFADSYCNKHLIYSIIETVLAKVLPEMAERTIADLMEDRGVSPVPGAF